MNFFLTRLLLGAFLIAGLSAFAQAKTILGVTVPETKQVAGKDLKLNGAGVRTATFLKVKVYVASFYAPEPMTTPEQVLASNGPLQFNFAFLRAFEKKKVTEAWEWQFEQSGDHTYPAFSQDKAVFVDAFGAIEKFGVETVEIDGNETRVFDDGVLKATITGKDFQKAFLSLWFGSKPVMKELKAAFLGEK